MKDETAAVKGTPAKTETKDLVNVIFKHHEDKNTRRSVVVVMINVHF